MKPALSALMTFGLTASIAAFCQAAQASFYTTSTRHTQFMLDESHQPIQGYYLTQAQGKSWYGNFSITQVRSDRMAAYYTGTFQDALPDNTQACSGNIHIIKLRQRSIPVGQAGTIEVNWHVTGGQNCPSVNQDIALKLSEPLPQPDASGNFNPENSDVVWSGTSDATWGHWQVVSTDGTLNCRSTPNGSIVHTYRTGAYIAALNDRSSSAFYQVSQPWVRTSEQCYVRANSQYIRPVSAP